MVYSRSIGPGDGGELKIKATGVPVLRAPTSFRPRLSESAFVGARMLVLA